MHIGDGFRDEIEQWLAAGQWTRARAALCELWAGRPSSAAAAFVVSCCERMRPHLPLTPCRLFILRSFTLEPAIPLLRAAAFLGGIDLTVGTGGFNAWAQEMLDPASALYGFAPDVVILAVETRAAAPELWEEFGGLSADQRQRDAADAASTLRGAITAFRRHSGASLVVHGLEVPSPAGVLDAKPAAIRELDAELRRIAAEFRGVHVLDYDALVARAGRDRWHDEKKWLTLRMPVRAECLPALAAEWMRFLHPLTGRVAKVLVTDLDNTLWGGVVGEDGIEGIQVGRDYPGAAWLELQRAMLDLHRRGILLAVASKNNPQDALAALSSHPGMLLRPEHFSAMRLNWMDKAAGLREIAAELNVGVDSLAFLDDNPAERQRIRLELPEAAVIELPADPLGYARALRDCPLFERLAISEEDSARSVYYSGQRRRDEARQSAASLEEFYHSLGQKVEIAPLAPATLVRAAQLTRKTNQFNLTTRRWTEPAMAEFAAEPGCHVWTVRVSDRFGDNGIVGLAMTRHTGPECELDTFLLSCRVIGRTVETAVLAFLAAHNRALGVERLTGRFLPTPKNAPAAGFYRSHGFQPAEGSESLWTLALAEASIPCPPWIELVCPPSTAYVHA